MVIANEESMRQGDGDVAGLGMARDIRQRFLHDAVNGRAARVVEHEFGLRRPASRTDGAAQQEVVAQFLQREIQASSSARGRRLLAMRRSEVMAVTSKLSMLCSNACRATVVSECWRTRVRSTRKVATAPRSSCSSRDMLGSRIDCRALDNSRNCERSGPAVHASAGAR